MMLLELNPVIFVKRRKGKYSLSDCVNPSERLKNFNIRHQVIGVRILPTKFKKGEIKC